MVELLVVVVVSGILIGVMFGPMNDLFTANSQGAKTAIQSGDTQTTVRSMEPIVRMATAFLDKNGIDDPAVFRGAGIDDWQTGGSSVNPNVLITSNYAVAGGTDPNRRLVYASDCVTPLQNNYIYFIKPDTSNPGLGTLYRRALIGLNPCSSGPRAQPSWSQRRTCESGCTATDAKLLINVKEFKLTFYDNLSNAQSSPINAKSVSVTIKTADPKTKYESTSTLRIKRINGS